MPHDPYHSLYLHIPYCKKRCDYCDFTTRAIDCASKDIDAYIDELCLEVRRLSKQGELAHLKSIFIGGGTPTFIGNKRLTQLLYMISVSVNLHDSTEFSVEANPDSLDERLVCDMWALGVNRLSIGVQSLDDKVLQTIGRVHDAETARNAIKAAQSRFTNINADIMCGIPGQSMESFSSTLNELIEMDLPHISMYPLTVEKNTPLMKRIKKGELADVDEDEQTDQMEYARATLIKAGYNHYEVSNYAKPGFECVHNMGYWRSKPYIGLGTSAVTMTQNEDHRMRKQDGFYLDQLDKPEMLLENVMLAMRTKEGIALETLKEYEAFVPDIFERINTVKEKELVSFTETHVIPTEKGWLFGNELYSEFVE